MKREKLLEVLDMWMPNDELSILGRKYKRQIVALIKSADAGKETTPIEIKPEVTDGWVEEKATGLIDLFLMREGKIPLLSDCKHFIRQLYEEMP